MGHLSDQLKKYLEETPKEQIEKDFFNIECHLHDIDPYMPEAKKLLKKMKRKAKWGRKVPSIRLTVDIVTTSLLYMGTGMMLVQKEWWLFALNLICGSYFMYKTLKDSRETW